LVLKAQGKFDEFTLVILGGVILIGVMAIAFLTPANFPPDVDPEEVFVTAVNGSSETFTLNISQKLANVTIDASGDIAGWLRFNPDKFGVITEYKLVEVTVNVPSTAAAGEHTGTITVTASKEKTAVPVTVNVLVAKKLSGRPINLGDFTVSFVSGSKSLDSKEDFTVSKGYFSSRNANLIGIVDDSDFPIITGGSVRLVIEDTNSFGNLKVFFNGELMHDAKTKPGELVIPIDASKIGRDNVVELKAGNPGFVFWGSTVYEIRSADFRIDFRGTLSKEFGFHLSEDEVRDFDHLQLTYRVKDASATLPPLTITVNNQTVFSNTPPLGLFNMNIDKSLSGVRLVISEENNINFSFAQEAYYEIGSAVLTVFKRDF
jgi:hypothetical protein